MQYKVPQNIDIEDKLIGPLTMLQFVYLLLGMGVAYASWRVGWLIFVIFGLPVALFTLALLFVKIQGQPFGRFLVSLIQYYRQPQKRIWHSLSNGEKLPAGPQIIVTSGESTEKKPIVPKEKPTQEELQEIARDLDQP